MLRPRTFEEYVGQKKVVDNLKIFVEAAQRRGEALDHVLLSGPPGIGKTTLAHLISGKLGVGLRSSLFHDGCAKSIAERFGPCGGLTHGHPELLSDAEKADMIVFLRSL